MYQQQDMNLRATVEILLHFNSLRNIDLFHQGVYILKAQIYQQLKEKKIYALPYNTVQGDIPNPKTTSSKYLKEAQSEDISFFSKAFAIRYCEEVVELDDMCIFRADFIEAWPSSEDGTKVVASFKSKLHSTFNGIHEFVPITFDEMHFCCVNTSIHSVLRDFTFKSIPEHHPIEIDESLLTEEDKINYNNGLQPTPKKKDKKNQQYQFQGRFNGVFPQNFKEFLAHVTQGFQRHQLDDFYHRYVRYLRLQHENFMIYFINLIDESLTNEKEILVQKDKVLKEYSAPFQQQMEDKQREIYGISKQNSQNNEQEMQKLSSLMMNSNFSDYFNLDTDKDCQSVCAEIQNEINNIAGSSFQLWYGFVTFFQKYHKKIMPKMEDDYNIKISKRWNESIFRKDFEVPNLASYVKRHVGKDHEKEAKKTRNKHYYQTLAPLNVEDLSLFPKADVHPMIFHDTYIKTSKAVDVDSDLDSKQASFMDEDSKDDFDHDKETQVPENDSIGISEKQKKELLNSNISFNKRNNIVKSKTITKDVHVFVMVHGYQGNNYDMRLMKDNIALRYPDVQFLSSCMNEDKTDGDIWDMGKRLAEETKRFIKEWCPNGVTKLSFVGHSLGGLIIRAAIPNLLEYQNIFYTYMTLSSPHLGFLYHNSKMVDAGLWVMKTWKKCISLKQLTLSDTKDIENSFIYQLAHTGSLDHFKNIVLVSSYQDSYVPFYSARIQNTPKTDKSESTRSKKYAEILQGVLGNIQPDRIHRIDVSFEIPEKSIDTMIGRAAHIQFLENMTLQKMFTYNFGAQFFE